MNIKCFYTHNHTQSHTITHSHTRDTHEIHTRYTPNTHRQQDNNKIKGLKPTENATRYQQVTAYPLMSGRNQPTQC